VNLTFEALATTSRTRADRWHPLGLDEWSVADWAVAMAGEAGEVCDAVKKFRRIETSVVSANPRQPADREAAVRAIAKEIGDTTVYLDLLAQRLGLRLEDCVRDTFNRISEREGFPERL
jgi:NTP pyrophosphatase (non-canonical NTP hydrolase)